MANSLTEEKKCAQCDRVLHGRSDQRFCNDTCRNTFNRYKRAAEKLREHDNTRDILNTIKHNYQLLKRHCMEPLEDNAFISVKTAMLKDKGFNPKFFTSTFKDGNGIEWKCVFEMGFYMGGDEAYLKDFPGQATL